MAFRSLLGHVEPLTADQVGQLRALLADAAASCFAEARIFPRPGYGDERGRPAVLGYLRGGHVEAAVLLGANLVPIATTEASRDALAAALIRMGRRSSSIVGPAAEVLPLWALLESAWGPARDIRAEQPLLVIDDLPAVPADPLVRPVAPHRLASYLPASIAMFTEEVGVDPRLGGMEHLYAQRVADLLQGRRALARFSGERVMFKAEIGAATARAVQIQGVWVDPVFRGRGLAAPGMAAVVEYGLRVAPMVTLYVNGYNTPALATYRTVGFRQVGTFATVLF